MSIEHLKEMKLVACMGCKRLMDCDESIQDQCGFMVLIEALYEAGFRKQEWISVEHRLPENDGDFLVWSDYYGVILGHYFARGRYFISKACNVTHWMPLPDCPNEKGGNQ